MGSELFTGFPKRKFEHIGTDCHEKHPVPWYEDVSAWKCLSNKNSSTRLKIVINVTI